MSFEVEYKLFNGRSKKKPNNNLKISQKPILNSVVNTYALSLFVGKFYDFSKNDHALLEKVVNKERDKQTEKFMDEVCKVCGKDEDLIVNVPRLRGYIKNFDEKIDSKRKQINKKLKKVCEEYALIKLDKNLVPSQKQHINDKNSYILAPNEYLEKHVKSLKSRSMVDDKKFAYMQDAAFIMMCLNSGEYFWKGEYEDFPSSQPDDLTFYLSGYVYEEAKVQRFLKSMNVLIIKRGFVMGLDKDNQALVFSNMGSKIFKFEIFKDRYVSFREDDALVIFSPAFFGNFDQIYDEIWKIKQNVIKIKNTPTKKSLRSLDDSLLLDPELIYKSLKDENIFVLSKFKKELDNLKNDLSYKNFEINKDRYARQWLIDDIYGLYLATHAPFRYKNSKELAKIYFEDILGKSLNLFIDEKRSPALGHHIDDLELL
ncbi:hypothetical protein [Campylobacter concisus]|mgnify:FL=1|uniref:hypothetical protein n=1 Tax=Campylobacter concisus TaxID=199 RepID=UPI00025A69EF|nr:hypothetical protein [Campylobacter concisus]EIF06756.1 hypothetical protein UNSWCD_660 [Campylobacter concisus UNSWCD]ERJ27536.1 hypothetical protein ATCC51561_813 [Campylobacter concisus ATCC 51561]